MKVHIDSSIRTSSGKAFGCISGEIDVAIEPQVGDSISFLPPKGVVMKPVLGFAGLLKVKTRVIGANDGSQVLSLSLEDVVVPTTAEARQLVPLFDKGFGLVVDVYDEEDAIER